jgi:hypothetical protein
MTMTVKRGRKRRDFSACDMALVDEMAVELAYRGTMMRLNAHERVAAVRMMLGQVPTGEIARRCATHHREIHRIARALDTIRCPRCRRYTFHDAGVLGRHIDKRSALCVMSGQVIT